MSDANRYDALRQTHQQVDEAERIKTYSDRADRLQAGAGQQPSQTAEQGTDAKPQAKAAQRDTSYLGEDYPARFAALKEQGITGHDANYRISREDQGTYIEPVKQRAPSMTADQRLDQKIDRKVDQAVDKALERVEQRARNLEQQQGLGVGKSQEQDKGDIER